MELFRVLICFRDGKNLQFCYKTEVASNVAYDAVTGAGLVPSVKFSDDYGNKATINVSDITAVVHTNVNDDLHSQTDLQVLQAHNEIYREKKMEADPMIREAIRKMQARANLAGMNGQRAM